MKSLLSAALVAVLGLGLAVGDADARRLGGGAGAGMKRSVPAQQPRPAQDAQAPAQTAPTQNAAARNAQATPGTPAAAGAAAAPARRSWLGPVAGLAAGLGLAALFSHLGMGAAVAEFVTLLLLVVLGFFLIRFVMRRLRPQAQGRMATAGGPGVNAGLGSLSNRFAMQPSTPLQTDSPRPMSAAPVSAPAGFDTRAFEQVSKQIFIRMQAANDSGDLGAMRQFTTPQMLQAVEQDLRERGTSTQRTDVVQLASEVIDVGREDGRDVVSVRFQGLIREVEGDVAQPFDEVWHLVRSDDGGWLLAGIQPGA